MSKGTSSSRGTQPLSAYETNAATYATTNTGGSYSGADYATSPASNTGATYSGADYAAYSSGDNSRGGADMNKGSGDTTTQTTTGALPDYIAPYINDLLARAKGVSNQPYVPYQNQRLAEFSGDTNKSFDMIRSAAAAGTPGLTAAANTAGSISGYNANPITAGQTTSGNVTAGTVGSNNVSTGNFNFKGIPNADLDAYINPYTENVLDVQKSRANRAYGEQQAGRDASAVAAGAFGGDRRFVQDSLATRDLNEQMQAMDATGLAAAYDNATGLFQSDEARRLAAYEGDAGRRLQADTGNADRSLTAAQFNVGNKLDADTGNVARRLQSDIGNADRGLSAAVSSEEARRLGKSLGLDAAIAQGALTQQGVDSKLGLAEALSGVGAKTQQRQQAGLDMAYQDFVNQRDYPAQQLQLYSQLLSGTPVTQSSTTSTTQPAPDFLSQLAGLAVGGAGLWDLFS